MSNSQDNAANSILANVTSAEEKSTPIMPLNPAGTCSILESSVDMTPAPVEPISTVESPTSTEEVRDEATVELARQETGEEVKSVPAPEAEQSEESKAKTSKEKRSKAKTSKEKVERPLPPFEIFTRRNLKAALKVFNETGLQKLDDEFLNGAAAFYGPAELMTLDEIKHQIDQPDAATKKTDGWHAMHYCLACLTGDELAQYVEKAKQTYSGSDWGELNKPARGSVGLLHALAMNADHEAALKAFKALSAVAGMPWSCPGGLLGLLPTHIAVINEAWQLAAAMEPLCAEAKGDNERLTCFPASSNVLKQILFEGVVVNPRTMGLRFTEESQNCPRALRGKAFEAFWSAEIRKGESLTAALSKMTFRSDTALKEVTKKCRLSSQWLNGLLSAMKPVSFSWTSLHCEVIDPECTQNQLNLQKDSNRRLLSCKDAHGRTPLFYALACGSKEAICWCLSHSRESDRHQYDAHHRSLLTALAMNPGCEDMLDLVQELISEENLQEDIFGISPVVYAMLCGKNELAKKIYELTQEQYLMTRRQLDEQTKKFKRAAKSLENEEMLKFLAKHETDSRSCEWAEYGCFY